MGIAASVDPRELQNYHSSGAAFSSIPERGDNSSKTEYANEETDHEENGRSFLVGCLHDATKTVSRSIFGSFLTSVLGGVLKDDSLHLNGIIYNNTVEALMSKLGGDFSGAFGERLFNGRTRIFGIKFPKFRSEVAAQFLPSFWAKGWRMISKKFNLNRISAKSDQSEATNILREYFKGKWWVKAVNKCNDKFEKHVKPALDATFSKLLGIRSGTKTIDPETGKETETPPQINWMHLGAFSGASLIATAFLPKHTQQFGFTDLYEAKGFDKVKRFVSSVGVNSLGRLESLFTRNVLNMHPEGYGFDAVMKASVREKMLTPLLQYVTDAASALASKYLPFNGAFLSLLARIPVETAATFLSSPLVGIAENHRVPEYWSYLAGKYWKPAAKVIEEITMPIFKYTVALFYKVAFGVFPSEAKMSKDLGHPVKYRPYGKSSLGDEAHPRYAGNTASDDAALFIKACLKMPKDAYYIVKSSYLKHGNETASNESAEASKTNIEQSLETKNSEKNILPVENRLNNNVLEIENARAEIPVESSPAIRKNETQASDKEVCLAV